MFKIPRVAGTLSLSDSVSVLSTAFLSSHSANVYSMHEEAGGDGKQ